MLDTSIIIDARNGRPAEVLRQFRCFSAEDLCLSAITLAEPEYGAAHSSDPLRNRMALMLFLSGISVMPFDEKAAKEYGRICDELQITGRLIGANDLLIAAHARSLDLTLIIHNTEEFDRISGLSIGDRHELKK